MTNLVDNLIKRGWVERREDPKDRRNRLICLTAAGSELSLIVQPIVDDFYSAVGDRLNEEEIYRCTQILTKIESIMSEI